jgi:hypothetical protein
LGSLCDGVAAALKHWPTVKLPELPRMADFASWVTAAESGFGWEQGKFLTLYKANRSNTDKEVLEDQLAIAIRSWIAVAQEWTGTATELHAALTEVVDDSVTHSTEWPRNGKALSTKLDRLAPSLRASGIDVDRDRTGSARLIRLRTASDALALSS